MTNRTLYSFLLTWLLMHFAQSLQAYDVLIDGIYYNLSDTEASVTYWNEEYYSYSYKGNIVIPETITINNQTYQVTSIGNNAFYLCINLKSVKIPSTITNIGYQAFSSCSGLSSIEIPESVTSIDEYAFMGCSGLTSIEIPSNISEINTSAFSYCSELKNVSMSNNVKSIGENAFMFCNSLTSVDLPTNLINIKHGAFGNCHSLTSVVIPSSVESISYGAWYNCYNLTSIVVDENNNVYDSRDNCNAIIETQTNTLVAGCNNTLIPSSVTSIGKKAFLGSGLTHIEIPNSITTIGSQAFTWCNNLTEIFIPASVTNIEGIVFTSDNLSSIDIDVNNIVYDSRKNCNAIIITSTNTLVQGCKNTIIPSTVTRIREEAFQNCKGLRSIVIPSRVTYIGFGAFFGCENLTSVTNLAIKPQWIGQQQFSTYGTLHVLPGCKSAYENDIYWNQFTIVDDAVEPIINISDGNTLIHNEDDLVSVSYSRTFANTNWQALYVPFAIPVDSLTEHGLQVAELNDTHQWDLDGDGAADSTRMEFFTLTTGSTEPNYPYLIKANETMELTLNLEDVEVKATEEKSYECSSLKQRFTFVGTYTGVSGADMYSNNYYGMAGGGLKRVADATVSLKPQRWYNKNGSPVSYYAPSIRFCVDGIEDESETTSIALMISGNRVEDDNIFSLDGIRHTNASLKPGYYVHQGKKLVIR